MSSNRKIPLSIKRFVLERANGCCEYCMALESHSEAYFSIEHIIPRVANGGDDIANLAFACLGCNWHKAIKLTALDSLAGELVQLFNPRVQTWTDHFQWSKNFTEVIGLTPCGRATVDALKMNRDSLKNQRFAMFAIGVHPPKHSFIKQ